MDSLSRSTGILIVGSGMAGLAAGSSLKTMGFQTLVVDKSLKVGGRLASKCIGPARFDYGAQFMTAREPRFLRMMVACEKAGVTKQWFTSSSGNKTSHPRWCGRHKMTAVAEHLAEPLSIISGQRLISVLRSGTSWLAHLSSGQTIRAEALLLTPPVPQTREILENSSITLPAGVEQRLERIKYDKCIAVLARLQGRGDIAAPGAIPFSRGPISWLADNRQKGISAVPAVTIHGAPRFSEEHWDLDRQESGRLLIEAAQPWLGVGVSEYHVHGWRYAKPVRVDEARYLSVSQTPPLLLAGDAFGGPRVEGAAMSGWKAAEALAGKLS